jgi:hypothetical protein
LFLKLNLLSEETEMSKVLELLLAADVSKIKKPSKDVEVKRLSEIFGEKIVFTCEAIDAEALKYINEASEVNGEFDIPEMRRLTVINGVKDPSLKEKELLKKFGAATPTELLKNPSFLLPGEILSLYQTISDLSGFGEKAVEEVKNS